MYAYDHIYLYYAMKVLHTDEYVWVAATYMEMSL